MTLVKKHKTGISADGFACPLMAPKLDLTVLAIPAFFGAMVTPTTRWTG